MVYTGKPSRGCQECKRRRIKCDEQRPSCGQCQKAKSGLTCPGYQTEFDLNFRDENKAIQRKANKALIGAGSRSGSSRQCSPFGSSPGSTSGASSSTSPLDRRESSSTQTPSDAGQGLQVFVNPSHTTTTDESFKNLMWSLENAMPPTLTMPPEFEAVPFFFKNFVSLPQQEEAMRGYVELLVPLYNQARPSSVLHMATNAVALAACGNYPGKQNLLRDAVTAYGKAIRKLNDALQDPVAAMSDETVLAILIFCLYETIMSTDDTIDAWGHHIDGAVTLTKLRGTDQFKRPMSHAVFRAVRTMMITSCVQRSKPIEAFPSKTGWVAHDISEENAANRLTLICIDLPNIRARANTLATLRTTPYNLAHEAEARDVMAVAERVDQDLQTWYQTLPPEWHYHTVGMVYEIPDPVEQADSWLGPQHAYHDVPVASIVNDCRVCRIFCQRVIMACLTYLGQSAYEKPISVIQQMVDEISACVPFHMSYDMQPVAQELGQERNAAEAFGGYSLVWPLYVAANAETVPLRQREWLSGRLLMIGTHFGLSSAQVLVLARRHVLTCGPMFP